MSFGWLEIYLDKLTPRERLVIEKSVLREYYTVKGVCRRLKITHQRYYQIRKSGLEKLRRMIPGREITAKPPGPDSLSGPTQSPS